jgi:type II secretory pathway pseudopilin PulG
MIKWRSQQRQRGFTTLELVLILVVIGILATLVITTRAGVQQNQRDAERQRDVKELRDGLEGYFAANNHYPTLAELNDTVWRDSHLKSIESDIYRDPSSSTKDLADKPASGIYAYTVSSTSGAPCGTAEAPCAQYTLTATLEGGGTYTKNNLN